VDKLIGEEEAKGMGGMLWRTELLRSTLKASYTSSLRPHTLAA
jgi:hypothetical protein